MRMYFGRGDFTRYFRDISWNPLLLCFFFPCPPFFRAIVFGSYPFPRVRFLISLYIKACLLLLDIHSLLRDCLQRDCADTVDLFSGMRVRELRCP